MRRGLGAREACAVPSSAGLLRCPRHLPVFVALRHVSRLSPVRVCLSTLGLVYAGCWRDTAVWVWGLWVRHCETQRRPPGPGLQAPARPLILLPRCSIGMEVEGGSLLTSSPGSGGDVLFGFLGWESEEKGPHSEPERGLEAPGRWSFLCWWRDQGPVSHFCIWLRRALEPRGEAGARQSGMRAGQHLRLPWPSSPPGPGRAACE